MDGDAFAQLIRSAEKSDPSIRDWLGTSRLHVFAATDPPHWALYTVGFALWGQELMARIPRGEGEQEPPEWALQWFAEVCKVQLPVASGSWVEARVQPRRIAGAAFAPCPGLAAAEVPVMQALAFDNPAKRRLKAALLEHRAEDPRGLVRSFLKKAAASDLDGLPPVVAALRRIAAQLGGLFPAGKSRLAEGATAEALEAFERECGYTLPDELRQLWGQHDGERKELGLIFGASLFSLRDSRRALQENLHDAAGKPERTGPRGTAARHLAWSRGWIPIGAGAESFWVVDLDPLPAGTRGQVMTVWPFQSEAPWVHYTGVAAMLEAIADELEAGSLAWNQDEKRLTGRS